MESFDLRQWPGFVSAGGLATSPATLTQVVIDSRRVTTSHALFVALPGRTADGHHFVQHAAQGGARYALVHQDWVPPNGIDLTSIQLLRVDHPLRALQQIAKTYRRLMPTTVIAVTGSQGKTMLKDMLQAYLSDTYSVMVSPESFNSQIGVALSLLNIRADHQIAIIEAGISQQGEMGVLAEMIAPNHAVITQIGDQHLCGLRSRSGIAREKAKLLNAVNSQGWMILPEDRELIPHVTAGAKRTVYWNRDEPTLPKVIRLPSTKAGALPFRVEFPDGASSQGELSFGFTYLLDLIAIATKAAWLLGVPSQALCERVAGYRPESTRTEFWRASNDVTLINRPYCADPQSIAIGLDRLKETPSHSRKHFIFGGLRGDGAAHSATLKQLGHLLNQHHLSNLALYGEKDFTSLTQALEGSSTRIQHYPSCQDALHALRPIALPGDHILIQGPHKLPIDHLVEAFDDSVSHNTCFINLAAVKQNVSTIRQCLEPSTRIMAIVKALAYGTEDIRLARLLATCGVDIFGVSYVDEGVALKRSGVHQSIFALNVAPYEVAKAVKWGIEVGVQDASLIEALAREAKAQGKQLPVHLHVDTGMGRLGCRPENALQLARLIGSLPSLRFEALMTHFSCADDPHQDTFTRSQIQLFGDTLTLLKAHDIAPHYVHAANSAATLRFPEAHFNMVRIGLALYGLYGSRTNQRVELKPALSLTSRVVGINMMKMGDSIGYSRRYQVRQPVEKIAILPIGYFDGLHRHFSDKGRVMIRGHRAPMVGNICMDYLMVDITAIPDVQVGDPVLIFGEDDYGQSQTPEELANTGSSVVHELITCLGPRIQRVFVDDC